MLLVPGMELLHLVGHGWVVMNAQKSIQHFGPFHEIPARLTSHVCRFVFRVRLVYSINMFINSFLVTSKAPVTTSVALVPSSDALVPSSFLLLVVSSVLGWDFDVIEVHHPEVNIFRSLTGRVVPWPIGVTERSP